MLGLTTKISWLNFFVGSTEILDRLGINLKSCLFSLRNVSMICYLFEITSNLISHTLYRIFRIFFQKNVGTRKKHRSNAGKKLMKIAWIEVLLCFQELIKRLYGILQSFKSNAWTYNFQLPGGNSSFIWNSLPGTR